ncbi:MAG: hypothetical protein N3G21_00790 [Candidatus Hydrogenedentes bacterium]|nr:hypothetical protein [Candidatus Hydrogenedentota bacterium]
MGCPKLHKFTRDSKFFVVDPQNTFCFECDEITYQIIDYYPEVPLTKVINALSNKYKYSEVEIREVWGELEFLRVSGLILKREKLESWVKEITTIPTLRKIVFYIDDTLVSGESRGIFFSRGLLKALPLIRREESNIELMFSACYSSLNDCGEIIESVSKYFPTSDKKHILVGYVFPLPYELAEKWRISTSDRVFVHLSDNTPEPNKIKKIEIYPSQLDLLPIVKRLVENEIFEFEIHFESLYGLNKEVKVEDIFAQINQIADYYIHILKKGKQLVINPFADMFNRVQKGIPKKISDPAGIHEWFISSSGEIYGGYLYYLRKLGKIGSIEEPEYSNKENLSLLNRGVDIIPQCVDCWAKHLCGGGNPVIHYEFTRKFNRPDKNWCDLQRDWIESMITKFQEVGEIDFSLVGKPLSGNQNTKISKFSILKHMFRGFLTERFFIRSVKPQDEAFLARWENWNTATYYSFFESTVFTTSMFEKEQEILNAQRGYEEYVIVDRRNNPRGLIRVRPEKVPNLTYIWVYFNNPEDYQSKSVEKSFQEIISFVKNLKPAGKYLFPVVRGDTKLSTFFERLGMKKLGTLREAVFFHRTYSDVDLYIL